MATLEMDVFGELEKGEIPIYGLGAVLAGFAVAFKQVIYKRRSLYYLFYRLFRNIKFIS